MVLFLGFPGGNQSHKTNHLKNQHPNSLGTLFSHMKSTGWCRIHMWNVATPKKSRPKPIQATQDVILIVRQIPGWTGMVGQTSFEVFRGVSEGWLVLWGWFSTPKNWRKGYKVRPCLVATMMAIGKRGNSLKNMVIFCIYAKFPGDHLANVVFWGK